MSAGQKKTVEKDGTVEDSTKPHHLSQLSNSNSCVPDSPCYMIHVRSFIRVSAQLRRLVGPSKRRDLQHLAAFVAVLQYLNPNEPSKGLLACFDHRCKVRCQRCGPGGDLWQEMVRDALRNLLLFRQTSCFKLKAAQQMALPDTCIRAAILDGNRPAIVIALDKTPPQEWILDVDAFEKVSAVIPLNHVIALVEHALDGESSRALRYLPPGIKIERGNRGLWQVLLRKLNTLPAA